MGKTSTIAGRLARTALFLAHFFILLTCTCGIGIGLWVSVEKEFLELLVGSNLHSLSAYLLITVGFVTLLLTFIGCLGTMKEIKCLLFMYLIVCSVLLVSILSAGTLIIVFRSEIKTSLLLNLRSSMQYHYGMHSPDEQRLTRAWDVVQRKYRCCGADATMDLTSWQRTEWHQLWAAGAKNNTPPLAPDSCCVTCSQLRQLGTISNDICANNGQMAFANKPTNQRQPLSTDEEFHVDQSNSHDSLAHQQPNSSNVMTAHVMRFCYECHSTNSEETANGGLKSYQAGREQIANRDWCVGRNPVARMAWPQEAYVNIVPCYANVAEEVAGVGFALGALSLSLAALMIVAIVASIVLLRDLYSGRRSLVESISSHSYNTILTNSNSNS